MLLLLKKISSRHKARNVLYAKYDPVLKSVCLPVVLVFQVDYFSSKFNDLSFQREHQST